MVIVEDTFVFNKHDNLNIIDEGIKDYNEEIISDTKEYQLTQSGDLFNIHKSSINNSADNIDQEVNNVIINLLNDPDCVIDSNKAKYYIIGEANISNIDFSYNEVTKKAAYDFTIRDSENVIFSTFYCIEDRLKELKTILDGINNINVDINVILPLGSNIEKVKNKHDKFIKTKLALKYDFANLKFVQKEC